MAAGPGEGTPCLNRLPLRENQKLHLLTFLVGGLCGLAAVAFHWLLESLQNGIIYRVAGTPGPWRAPLLILVPALGGLVAGAVLYFYAPEARGSGIPQVKAAFLLEGGRIPARVIPAKMLLPALNIGTGASLGREGPTVQICAAIASLLGRVFDLSRERLRSLVPVGAAAGLAAAFNTPIAAVTFTLEEILGDTAAKPLGSIVIASVIASVVERSLLGEHALFSVPPYRLNSVSELPFYVLLGVVAGCGRRGIQRLAAEAAGVVSGPAARARVGDPRRGRARPGPARAVRAARSRGPRASLVSATSSWPRDSRAGCP